MKKKNLLTAGSVALTGAAVMLAPLGAQMAMAAVNKGDKATLTVGNLNALTQGFAYKIIDAGWEGTQPTSPQFTWNAKVAPMVREINSKYIGEHDEVTSDFAKLEKESAPLDSFYQQLARKMADADSKFTGEDKIKINVSGEGEEKTGTAQLPMGGYLVLFNNDVRVYKPAVVNAYPDSKTGEWVMGKQEINIKAKSTPLQIKKDNDKKTTGIGTEVEFTINASVPTYPEGTEAKTYSIIDTLPKGLVIDEASVSITDGNSKDLKSFVKGGKGAVSGQTITWDFKDKIGELNAQKVENIKITYKAKVTKEAASQVGQAMENTATIDYNHNPYGVNEPGKKVDPPTSTTENFTYGFDISKTDSGKQALKGATFSIKADGEKEFIKVVKGDKAGVYHVADETEVKSAVTEMATDDNGKLYVDGLSTGKYEVEEIKAPHGYVKLQEPLKVEIIDKTGGDNGPDGIVDQNPSTGKPGFMSVNVENNKGFTWPTTGGKGTVMFAAVGSIVVVAGVGGVLYSKKKATEK